MKQTSNDFSQFTGLYQLSETLCFELKPIGKTLENWLDKTNYLHEDRQRVQAYEQVKELLDKSHRDYIEDRLKNAVFNWQPLAVAWKQFKEAKTDKTGKTDPKSAAQKLVKAEQTKLRKEISDRFTKDENQKEKNQVKERLRPKKIIDDLIKQGNSSEALHIFQHFATFFEGYRKNRENMYVAKEQTTAIPYRIVHDNFPKFLNNCEIFEKLQRQCQEVIQEAKKELAVENGITLQHFFSVNSYNEFLSQKGIEKYNFILGGQSGQAKEKKKKGINEFINLYNQQQQKSADRIGRMKPLFKQILAQCDTFSFRDKKIENDSDMIKLFQQFCNVWFPANQEEKSPIEEIAQLLSDFSQFDHSKIYLQTARMSDISSKYYKGNWQFLSNALVIYAADELFKSVKGKSKEKKIANYLKQKYIPLEVFDAAVEKFPHDVNESSARTAEIDHTSEKNSPQSDTNSYEILSVHLQDIQERANVLKINLEKAQKSCQNIPDALKEHEKYELFKKPIREALDAAMDFFHHIEIFAVPDEYSQEDFFYGIFLPAFEKMQELIPVYNMIRNYITRKPSEKKKIRLTFSCSKLADGWDHGREKANKCVLFIRDNAYYLGIVCPEKGNIDFEKMGTETAISNPYRKMFYKQIPNPTKELPWVFFSPREKKKLPKEFVEQYEMENKQQGSSGDPHFPGKLIDFYKKGIAAREEWKIFNFHFKPTEKYSSVDDFCQDVARQAYIIKFTDIAAETIDKLVEDGKLFLFQIYNKDFAPGAHGKANLHTLYWKALFEPENQEKVIFKLNGQSALFYREKIIFNPVCHKQGSFVVKRTYQNDEGMIKSLPENIHKELYEHANNPEKILSSEAQKYQSMVEKPKQISHEIVKDRRYTEEKFLFHVPLTINFMGNNEDEDNEENQDTDALLQENAQTSSSHADAVASDMAKESAQNVNDMVQTYLRKHPDTRVIGIDRGERNLLYYSVIDNCGKIQKQGSLNIIDGVDYQAKLDLREQERKNDRRNWNSIGGIKDLKAGYLSLVVRTIADLMLKYHAIVVLEDLNNGFKRGRFKVEKQVYQNFEISLIKKLNYLVWKERDSELPGGIRKGYQLTQKFKSYDAVTKAKQSGFLFYVPAEYTSKIDPATGFVNLFRLNDLTNMEKRQNFFAKFEEILFDGTDFQFTFDYSKFNISQTDFVNKWTVSSRGKRIGYNRETKENFEIKPTEKLKEAFLTAEINFPAGVNLVKTLEEREKNRENEIFFARLWDNFKWILQMRNSKSRSTAREDDYILSPVADKDGHYFDSRTAAPDMPQDADANGAYHIALKGRMLIEALTHAEKANLAVNTADYLKFVQKRHL